ncbi:TPR domain protein, putative component of TonB system [Grimontia indica]|uniref:TPR domain protein, putative component of TonB system n=1 Tax=Grimontia indica TaxID=1056512 RepID=R1GPA9_9GAMM|nr:tetratricopeptide repeat protein [Grimontia indica]EOD78028.1 TPR domain protein, putative component of TonB system [Grimontia indica]
MKLFGVGVLLLCASLPAFASDPDFARHLNRIETLLSNDEVDKAADLAKAIVSDNEEQNALHQRLLGYIYLNEGDYNRAYLAYTKALEYRKLPESLRQDVLGALVSLSMKRGRPEVAIQYGKTYLAEFPTFQPVEHLYTRALFSEKRYAEALKQANAIIARYADVPEFIWQIKLLSEEQLQQHRALINTTRVIQDKFGHDIRWQRKKASAYAALGEVRAALRTLREEAKAGATLTEADYLNMSQYASMLGDTEQAKRLLNQGISSEAVTVNRDVLKRKLQYHMQSMEWMEAWEVVSLLNREPELSLVKVQVKIASQLQRWQEAANLAQQAIDMGGSRDAFLWEILGFSAMKTNQLELARSAYERLKMLDPHSDADVWLKTLELMGKE